MVATDLGLVVAADWGLVEVGWGSAVREAGSQADSAAGLAPAEVEKDSGWAAAKGSGWEAAVGSGLVAEEDSDSAEEAGLGSAADWAKGLEAAAG